MNKYLAAAVAILTAICFVLFMVNTNNQLKVEKVHKEYEARIATLEAQNERTERIFDGFLEVLPGGEFDQ